MCASQASPFKGKRTRGEITVAAAAAAVRDLPQYAGAATGAVQDSSIAAMDSDGSNGGGGNSGSSPRRLAVRCRLNGSTPAAMVVKSRVRQPPAAAAAAVDVGPAGGVLSDIDN